MRKAIILALPVIVLCLLYYQEVRVSRSLRSELSALKIKLSEKSLGGEAPRNRVVDNSKDIDPEASKNHRQKLSTPEVNKKDTPILKHKEQKDSSVLRSEFHADRQLEGIDETLSLSDDEKLRLKDRLSKFFQADESGLLSDEEEDARLNELLSTELGEERADLYMGIKRDRETKAENDRIELASSIFKKRLNLSAQQEIQVSTIIRQVDIELGAPSKMIGRKIQDLHVQGDNEKQDPAQAMKQFGNVMKEIRDKRRSALNDRLQSVLTKDQYKALLSEQAESQGALWGLRGY